MRHIRHYTAFAIVSVIILIGIALLHPTLNSLFFPFIRTYKRERYIAHILSTQKIDPQEFWQFREFYYPGSITFTKVKGVTTPHTVFISKYLKSEEFLIDAKPQQNSIQINQTTGGVEILFTKPVSEMIRANGFFDSKDKDKQFLNGTMWFVRTFIKT